MKIRISLVLAITLSALMVILAAMTSSRARAQAPSAMRELDLFGMVGITRGQTARLNVVFFPGQNGGNDMVHGELKFVDGNGDLLLGNPGCIPTQDISCSQKTVTLMPGQSASFDVNGDSVAGNGMTRVQIRPVIIWQNPAIIWQKKIIATMEMIDNATSRTSFIYVPTGPICGAP